MRKFTKICSVLLLVVTLSVPTFAQGLIRDAEIESSLRQIAKPLLKEAGLPSGGIKFFIVNSNKMNAFVLNGRNIFINYGLIQKLKTPEQLQAVIAHELAHIKGGHFAQRVGAIRNAQNNAVLGLVLGLAIAAAGEPGAAAGVISGTSSTAQRGFFAHTRAQEDESDRIGLRMMMNAGINPQSMVEVLEIFEGQDLLTAKRRDPYAQTHPLTPERLSRVRAIANANQDRSYATNPTTTYFYNRMRAKFAGFIGNPSAALRRIGKKDNSETAVYARAIAYHKLPNRKKAAQEIAKLLKIRPNDPFYNELNGQFQLENGNPKAAIASYQRAIALAPREPQILAGLGRAQLAGGQSKSALATLQKAYARDSKNGRMLRDLATAYAKNGQPGLASVVTAERFALQGNFGVAKTHAQRALSLLPNGSVGANKARDILAVAKRSGRS
ncbi:MAG: M48 family metalloprotease [Pseudomonadota bacterium]